MQNTDFAYHGLARPDWVAAHCGVVQEFTQCVRNMKVETGARLRLARLALKEAYGVTHANFCRTMGISPSALSNYETGTNWVSPPLLIRMKEKFGVTIDYVYTGALDGLPKEVAKEIAKLESPV